MRDHIDSLQLTCKNHIFVQGDGFCNNTSSIGNCRQNGILVLTMCISRFEHKSHLSIDSNSLVKCMPLLTYLNVISRPKAIQNWDLLYDLIVYRYIQGDDNVEMTLYQSSLSTVFDQFQCYQ